MKTKQSAICGKTFSRSLKREHDFLCLQIDFGIRTFWPKSSPATGLCLYNARCLASFDVEERNFLFRLVFFDFSVRGELNQRLISQIRFAACRSRMESTRTFRTMKRARIHLNRFHWNVRRSFGLFQDVRTRNCFSIRTFFYSFGSVP